MKSKYIYLYISLFVTLLGVSSCIKDTGNYDYMSSDDLLPVKVSALRDTTVVQGTTLKITPEIKITGDESKYTYLWYVVPIGASTIKERVELGKTKELSTVISVLTGDYTLCLEVRDSKLDIAVISKAAIRVQGTIVGLGWFILKDTNNETDFDYINRDGVLYKDILRGISPDYLPKGTAVGMAYQKDSYKQEIVNESGITSTLVNESIYQVLSSNDMKTINAKTLEKYKDFTDQFYEAPSVSKPQKFVKSLVHGYLLNDGVLWYYLDFDMGVGKFSNELYLEGAKSYLHRDLIVSAMAGVSFDTISRSFLGFGFFVPLTHYADKAGMVSPSKMNYRLNDMLMIGELGVSDEAEGFAIMQGVNPLANKYYFIKLSAGDVNTYPFENQPEMIPDNCRMPKSSVKAASVSGNVIYFAEGNKLSYYAHATELVNRETLIKTFAADETISYIHDYKYSQYKPEHDLVVLTNSPRGWKFYAFPVNSPGEIQTQPILEFEGTGIARSVMLRLE